MLSEQDQTKSFSLVFLISDPFLFSIALTKLDVLDDLEELKIGVAYIRNGERLPSFPGEFFIYTYDS